MINIFNSRRSKFYHCHYWCNIKGNWQEWVLNNEPNGFFYAKPSTPISKSGNPIQSSFLVDANNITIETNDDIKEIKQGCLVSFNNRIWMVENAQNVLSTKKSQFRNGCVDKTILTLRR